MSNSLAIATATAALSNLLTQVRTQLPDDPDNLLSDTDITRSRLDKARTDEARNQLNLFLYQLVPNAALRNLDTRAIAKPGDTSPPPLALNLHYLLTAYGRTDDELVSHRLLGCAMAVLHRNPVLSTEQLRTALPGNTLYQQIERIRISPLQLSPEEMSRLWTIFHAKYQLSMAYQVSVVIIDSGLPVSTAPLGPRVAISIGPQPVGGSGTAG